MTQLTSSLNWRYATKIFDPTKKISDTDLSELIESVRLTPTSYGLQTFRLINVKDLSLRQQIKDVAWSQSQVVDCSNLFVFVSQKTLTQKHIDKFFRNLETIRHQTPEQSSDFRHMIEKIVSSRTPDSQEVWHAKQTYIALGFLLLAAAEKQIDSCPMEGFDSAKVGQILGVSDNEVVTLLCPLGYRSAEDATASRPKVRFPIEDFFSTK